MLIDSRQYCVCIIHVQDRPMLVAANPGSAAAACGILLRAAGQLGRSVLRSEQHAQELEPTVAARGCAREGVSAVNETAFSCLREPTWRERLHRLSVAETVLCRGKAQIAILQTVLDLAAGNAAAFVVTDAVTSRIEACCQYRGDGADRVLNSLGDAGGCTVRCDSGVIR